MIGDDLEAIYVIRAEARRNAIERMGDLFGLLQSAVQRIGL